MMKKKRKLSSQFSLPTFSIINFPGLGVIWCFGVGIFILLSLSSSCSLASQNEFSPGITTFLNNVTSTKEIFSIPILTVDDGTKSLLPVPPKLKGLRVRQEGKSESFQPTSPREQRDLTFYPNGTEKSSSIVLTTMMTKINNFSPTSTTSTKTPSTTSNNPDIINNDKNGLKKSFAESSVENGKNPIGNQIEQTETYLPLVQVEEGEEVALGPNFPNTPTISPSSLHQHKSNIHEKILGTPLSRQEYLNQKQKFQLLYPEWLASLPGGIYLEDQAEEEESSGFPRNRTEHLELEPIKEKYIGPRRLGNGNYNENGVDEDDEDAPEREESDSRRNGIVDSNLKGNNNNKEKKIKKVPEEDSVQVNNPNNGLADIISRGRIDSVMYVYFGDKLYDYHKEEIAGRIIQAVGGVLAAIAQLLIVLGAARSIRKENLVTTIPAHLHIGFALLISNLLLLLAVHATEPIDVCATVAVILHYLYLVIGAWFLAYTIQTYRALRHYVRSSSLLVESEQQYYSDTRSTEGQNQLQLQGRPIPIITSTLQYTVFTWTSPFPFIIMSYLGNPDCYETRRYCWMSIEKGMVVPFIVPIFLLIGLNTLLVILSLRHLLALRKLWQEDSFYGSGTEPPPPSFLDDDLLDEKSVSSGIRASAMLLPLLAISWFLNVIGLENPRSIFFQLTSAVANVVLSWLVMYFLGDEICSSDIWCPRLCCPKSRRNLSSSSIENPSGSSSSSAAPLPSSGDSSSVPSVQPTEAISVSYDISQPLLLSTEPEVKPGPSFSTSISSPVQVPGPSSSSTTKSSIRWPHKKHHPNWSRPGGNEIYELKLDSISTIYK